MNCNLRVLMAEQGLNIQKVKDNTTLSRTTISNLYNNYGAGIQFDTLRQLCKLLKCQPGDLFTYYDAEVEFSIIDDNIDEYRSNIAKIYEIFRRDSSIDQSINSLQLLAKCYLIYQGNKYNFDFLINIIFKFESSMSLNISVITSKPFSLNIENIDLPYPVETHIKEKYEDYLMEWVTIITEKPLDGWGPIQFIFDFKIEE